jgi:hypothetical protein
MAKKVTTVSRAEVVENAVVGSGVEPETVTEIHAPKVTRYIVRSVNPFYDGKTCGLKFENGRALLDPGALDARLGLDFDQVVLEFENMPGYSLIPVLPGQDVWTLLRGIDMQNPEVALQAAINDQAARNIAERARLRGAT